MAQSYQDGSCKLSTLDQLMPRIYSPMFLVYETDQYENAVKTLNEGLAKATSVLPYLRGSVHKSDDPRNQLTLSWSPQDPPPTVVETPAPESLPSFEQLKQDNGPLSVFQDALAPVPALINYQDPGTKVPTFVIGVTRMDGGLIMSLCAHHVVMDGAGMGLFLKLWGDCIRGEPNSADGKAPFDAGEVNHRESWLREASGFSKNEPKATLEELLRQHPEFSLRSIPSSMPATVVPSQPAKYAAKIFAFSSAKLQEAKQAISGSVPAKSPTINNVLGAALWLSITRIRLERMSRNGPAPAADSTTKLGFAINARSRLGPAVSSKSFLGNVTMLKIVEFPATKLESIAGNALASPSAADLPLMEPVISAMAAATAAVTPTHVSEMIAFAERIGDFEEIGPGWNSFHLDLSYTSWANLGMYDADFGPSLGGKPRFVRIPYMPYIDGMVLALPRRGPTGGEAVERIEVALMLNEEDMRALEEDEILRSWSV